MAHEEALSLYLVSVAQGTFSGVHDISNGKVLVDTAHHQDVVQADLVLLSLINVLVKTVILSKSGRVLLLPQPPETINLSMVQEEERLCNLLDIGLKACNGSLTVGRSSGVHLSTQRSVNATMRSSLQRPGVVTPVTRGLNLLDSFRANDLGHDCVCTRLGDFGQIAMQTMAAISQLPGLGLEVFGS
jgi:hypothetical protein